MRETPLTPEQRDFAERHHNLVYTFLHRNRLPEDEFYDVVIFGYLRAVRRHMMEPRLRRYSFSTVAWKAMRSALGSHRKAMAVPKHDAELISLNTGIYEDGQSLEERLAAPDTLMLELETRLLFHELAKLLSRQQMEMVRLKHAGYSVREIARRQKVPIQHVYKQLRKAHKILLELGRE